MLLEAAAAAAARVAVEVKVEQSFKFGHAADYSQLRPRARKNFEIDTPSKIAVLDSKYFAIKICILPS